MKAVEFPLGNLREYFFNEILSKMTPRMGDYSPLQGTSHVWWENVVIVMTIVLRRSPYFCSHVYNLFIVKSQLIA